MGYFLVFFFSFLKTVIFLYIAFVYHKFLEIYFMTQKEWPFLRILVDIDELYLFFLLRNKFLKIALLDTYKIMYYICKL